MAISKSIYEPSPTSCPFGVSDSQNLTTFIPTPWTTTLFSQTSSSSSSGLRYPATDANNYAYDEFCQSIDIPSGGRPLDEPFTPTRLKGIQELEDEYITYSPCNPATQSANATVPALTINNTENAAHPTPMASQTLQTDPQVPGVPSDSTNAVMTGPVTARGEQPPTEDSVARPAESRNDKNGSLAGPSGHEQQVSPTALHEEVHSIDARSRQGLIKATSTNGAGAQSAIQSTRKRTRSTTNYEEAQTKRVRRLDTPSTNGSEFGSSSSDTIVASEASTPITSQEGDEGESDRSGAHTPSFQMVSQDKGKARGAELVDASGNKQVSSTSFGPAHTPLAVFSPAIPRAFTLLHDTSTIVHARASAAPLFTWADDTWDQGAGAQVGAVPGKKAAKNTKAAYAGQQGMMSVFAVQPASAIPIKAQPVLSVSWPTVLDLTPMTTRQGNATPVRVFKNTFCALGTYDIVSNSYQGPRQCHQPFPATEAGVKAHLAEHDYPVYLEKYQGKDFLCPWIGCKHGWMCPSALCDHIWEAHVGPGAPEKVCSNWVTCRKTFEAVADEPLCEPCDHLRCEVTSATLGSATS